MSVVTEKSYLVDHQSLASSSRVCGDGGENINNKKTFLFNFGHNRGRAWNYGQRLCILGHDQEN